MAETLYKTSVRAGFRLAADRMERLDSELLNTMAQYVAAQRVAGGSHLKENQRLCSEAFTEASSELIRTVVEMKGPNARNNRDQIVAAMIELRHKAMEAFANNDGTPLYRRNDTAHQEMEEELTHKTNRILADFDDGVYHMASNKSLGSTNINIENIHQLSGHVGSGNYGSITANQSLNEGDVFRELATAVKAQVEDAEVRDKILKAIEQMRQSQDDKNLAQRAYAEIIAHAANHMSIVAPFLPALIPYIN